MSNRKDNSAVDVSYNENNLIASLLEKPSLFEMVKPYGAELYRNIINMRAYRAMETLYKKHGEFDAGSVADEMDRNAGPDACSLSHLADLLKNSQGANRFNHQLSIAKESALKAAIGGLTMSLKNDDISVDEFNNEVSAANKRWKSTSSLLGLDEVMTDQDDFYFGKVEDKDMVFDSCMPMGEVAMLVAAGGTGKSFATIHLSVAVALGVPAFMGYNKPLRPSKQGKVVVIGAEDFRDDYRRRVRKVIAAMEVTQKDSEKLKDNLIFKSMVGEDVRIVADDRGSAHVTGVIDSFARELSSIEGLRMVVLDPMSAFYGSNENDNSTATMFINAIARICKEIGCAVLLVHHSSKGSAGSSRGASGFVDRCRTLISMKTIAQQQKDSGRKTTANADENNTIVMSLDKTNHAKFWDEPVFLKRGDGGSFTSVKPTLTEKEAAKMDEEEAQYQCIIDYIKGKGGISGTALIESKSQVFSGCKAAGNHKIRDMIKTLKAQGKIVEGADGLYINEDFRG